MNINRKLFIRFNQNDEVGGTWNMGVGEMRNAYRILVKNLKANDHMDDVAVVRRVIMNCILKE